MFSRIDLLRNVGQFDSVAPGTGVSLSNMSVIYAENGRGKTTLAAILRSLSIGNVNLIIERQRLGTQHTPHVVLNANNQSYIFQSGVWSAQLPDIAIFDDHFVAENVCSGIEIVKEHRQNLHELILGAQGVALNSDLQLHVVKIEEHNSRLREKEGAIPASGRGGLTVDAFCSLEKIPNIEIAIQEAERNLAAATAAEAIRTHQNFLNLSLPSFDINEINRILQLDLPGLQVQTTKLVQEHLAKLGKNSEAWINEGMQKIESASAGNASQSCPFCAQNLDNSELISHYGNYFSDRYRSHKDAIIALGKSVAQDHDTEILAAFERAVRVAAQTAVFWGQFMSVAPLQVDTAQIALAWKAAREPVLALLRAKLTSPLDSMSLSPDVISAVEKYHTFREEIGALSTTLQNYNPEIALVKERSASANVAAITIDLAKLKTNHSRFTASIDQACIAYVREKEAKSATEALRGAARTALDQYRTSIFTRYESAINNYLNRFNAGFRLSSVTSVNTRAGSSCTYNVLINNVSVSITAETGPSFKNTLSAGDRNTLALAFFFSSLDQDPALAQKIVIIDDPITSLDEHRSLSTIHEIRDLVRRVKQVIVLSHSKPFLAQVWDGADRATRSSFKIIRSGQSSTITPWDVNQDTITENDKRHALIKEYINVSDSTKEREVATALRYILEAFLRVAYPSHFPPGTLLGQFHGQCTQALTASNPILNQNDTTELRRLIDYANKFHHDTNPAYATELINDQELLDYCKRVLNFAKRG